jgi:hypothetical protein
MDSKKAIAILVDIEVFLQFSFTRLTLTELENNSYTNNYSDKILPQFTISRHMPFNIETDNGSCYLLPEEYKDMVCGRSTADGNCLFNSASIILYGNENYCAQLRLAVIIELMKNIRRYLEIEAFETDIIYSESALDSAENLNKQNLNNSERPKYFAYLAELKRMCNNFSWCSLVALYGLANVVKQPVHSIYPEIKSRLIRGIYNCEIKPFQKCVNQSSDNTEIILEHPLFILWTNTSVNTKVQANELLIENKFIPNHFVPCFLKNRKVNLFNAYFFEILK